MACSKPRGLCFIDLEHRRWQRIRVAKNACKKQCLSARGHHIPISSDIEKELLSLNTIMSKYGLVMARSKPLAASLSQGQDSRHASGSRWCHNTSPTSTCMDLILSFSYSRKWRFLLRQALSFAYD